MRRWKAEVVATVLAAIFAIPASAQPRPSVITRPDWLRKPTGEDMAHNYPQAAVMMNLEGRTILHCSVAVSGRLEDCEVREETPKGIGFGKATLALSRGFLMRPQTRDGVPVSGGQVNIPIAFRLPVGEPYQEPPPPAPKSSETLALALQFVAAAKATERTAQSYEQAATTFDEGRMPDVSAENSGLIAKAIRAAYPIRLQEVADRQAQLYASLFTAKELASLEAFFRTKAADVLYARTAEAQAFAAAETADGRRRQVAVSRDIFCASHTCVPSAPGAEGPDAPQWLHIPTTDQVWQSRPALAQTFNLPGSAQLTCTVIAQGALSACRVVHEAPTGLGFGGAALTLTGFYSLDLTAPKAVAVGQSVNLDIGFDALPEDAAQAATAVAARSPGSQAMAHELLAIISPPIANPTALQRQRAAAQPPAQGVTRADQAVAFDAMDQAYGRVRAEMMDKRASWLTTQLTDTELLAALKIWRGGLGSKWQAQNEALSLAAQKAVAEANRRIWADVDKAFCATQACYAPPPRAQPAIGASSAPSTRTP